MMEILLHIGLNTAKLLQLLLFVFVLLSWFPRMQGHPVHVFLANLFAPMILFLRRFVPRLGMFDFSAIVLFLLLIILENVLAYFLSSL